VRINTNVAAENAYRLSSMNNKALEKSIQKISSSLRINKAGDDAAGLAISEKLRGQIRGLGQVERNIQDGISMIQTAEAGMQEIHSLLQRGREISVQAGNDTLVESDKNSLQQEINQIIQEIDRIAETTNFNTINLLNCPTITPDPEPVTILTGLKSSWLEQSESLITDYYGLTSDGAELTVNIIQGVAGGTLASVSGLYNTVTGLGSNLYLNIEKADFLPGTLPNGQNPNGSMFDDRILAHEMTHAVMARTMNFFNLPTWFKEGVAEFASGADERLYYDSILGTDFTGVVGEIASWEGTSIDYSSAYAAVRYLHSQLKAAGGTGIKELLIWLNENQPADLDDALAVMQAAHPGLVFNSVSTFVNDYDTNGVAFLTALNTAGAFTNDDTGAVGGADADGGPVKDAASVVSDIVNYTDTPLVGFEVIWPTIIQESTSIYFQAGANTGQSLEFRLCDMRSISLGLTNVDVVNQASTAISMFDTAIVFVASECARLGALQNRLEHTISVTVNIEENLTSSESRIRDADMAKEIMGLAKTNILYISSTSMLAQANQQPQSVLKLLEAS